MKVIVIRDMSAGNETVGEAWQETKTFDSSEPIKNIVNWAFGEDVRYRNFNKNIKITVPHEEQETEKIHRGNDL